MDHEERLRRLKEIGERAEREAIERNRAPCLERVIVKLVNGIFECLPILRRQFPRVAKFIGHLYYDAYEA